MKLVPLDDQVLIQRVEDEATTKGGLLLTTSTKVNKGVVVDMGISAHNELKQNSVNKDDVVLFTGREVTATGDESLLVMPYDEIVAVIKE